MLALYSRTSVWKNIDVKIKRSREIAGDRRRQNVRRWKLYRNNWCLTDRDEGSPNAGALPLTTSPRHARVKGPRTVFNRRSSRRRRRRLHRKRRRRRWHHRHHHRRGRQSCPRTIIRQPTCYSALAASSLSLRSANVDVRFNIIILLLKYSFFFFDHHAPRVYCIFRIIIIIINIIRR